MVRLRHLLPAELHLHAGEEWKDETAVWHFLRVARGAAYWIGNPQTIPLSEGEILVANPRAKGVVRASLVGDTLMHVFSFAPDLLYGLLTLAEHRFFQSKQHQGKQAFLIPVAHPAAERFSTLADTKGWRAELTRRADALGVVAAIFLSRIKPRNTASVDTGFALRRFQELIGTMVEKELLEHTPEDLANICGCSVRHFNRLFLKHFGVSARRRRLDVSIRKNQAEMFHTAEPRVQSNPANARLQRT